MSTLEGLPLVTVIVPAYNHENYILQCIESILDQDYPNLELIVINDGSSDSTGEKVAQYLKTSSKTFQFISKENEGLIKTLNLGLSLAKGKYFCEVASDDILFTTSIRERVDFLEEHTDCNAVFTNGIMIDSNGEELGEFFSENKRGFTTSQHSLKDFIERKAIVVFPTGMFKQSLIEDLDFFDEDCRYFEDISVIYKMILRYDIGYMDKKLYTHRIHGSNTSSSQRMAVREEKIAVLKKLIDIENGSATKNLLKKELSRQYWNYYKLGKQKNIDSKKLQLALRNSVKARPFHIKSLKAFYNMVTLRLRGL